MVGCILQCASLIIVLTMRYEAINPVLFYSYMQLTVFKLVCMLYGWCTAKYLLCLIAHHFCCERVPEIMDTL